MVHSGHRPSRTRSDVTGVACRMHPHARSWASAAVRQVNVGFHLRAGMLAPQASNWCHNAQGLTPCHGVTTSHLAHTWPHQSRLTMRTVGNWKFEYGANGKARAAARPATGDDTPVAAGHPLASALQSGAWPVRRDRARAQSAPRDGRDAWKRFRRRSMSLPPGTQRTGAATRDGSISASPWPTPTARSGRRLYGYSAAVHFFFFLLDSRRTRHRQYGCGLRLGRRAPANERSFNGEDQPGGVRLSGSNRRSRDPPEEQLRSRSTAIEPSASSAST